MKRVKLLSLFLILFCCISAVSALDKAFDIEISPQQVDIKINETAVFQVTIHNNLPDKQIFEIYSPDVEWDIAAIPNAELTPHIDGESSKNITLYVRPLYVNPGLYGVGLTIKLSNQAIHEKRTLLIGIGSLQNAVTDYLPAIKATLDIPKQVDPRVTLPIKIELTNQNRKKLDDIVIKIRSDIINKDYETTLGALESKLIQFDITLDPLTPPKEDLMRISLFAQEGGDNYQFDIIPQEFEILRYGEVSRSEEITKQFLRTEKKFILKNDGNKELIQPFKIEAHLLTRMFTSTIPQAVLIKEEGATYYSWEINLAPTEIKEIYVVNNYRPLFVFLIALLVIILVHRMIQSPLVLKKRAEILASSEGGISEIKIIIEVKNRSPKKLKNIEIMDRITNIADIINKFDIGTLQPTKILRHDTKGTLVKWNLDELDRFEERLITYKIKTKLSIIGGMKLPAAIAKFVGITGKLRHTHSNVKDLVQ